MITIRLSDGSTCVVSDEDADLAAFRWNAAGKGYASGYMGKGRYSPKVYIHAVVAERVHGPRPLGLTVDHEDRNRANNTRPNLRYVTRSKNNENRGAVKKNKFAAKGLSLTNRGTQILFQAKRDGIRYRTRFPASQRDAAITFARHFYQES